MTARTRLDREDGLTVNEEPYPMLAALAESVGAWRHLERFAVKRFGAGSPEHNMVRERLAINLGADFLLEEETAIEQGGDSARQRSRELRAEHDMPSAEAWDSFWPNEEAQRYHDLVQRAQRRMAFRLRREMRRRWTRLTLLASVELGDEFRDLSPPDWLDA